MEEFARFDKMLTPGLIKVIFWLGLGIDAIVSLGAIRALGGLGFLLVLVAAPLFALLWRVFCERIIITFKIHEELQRISSSPGNLNL